MGRFSAGDVRKRKDYLKSELYFTDDGFPYKHEDYSVALIRRSILWRGLINHERFKLLQQDQNMLTTLASILIVPALVSVLLPPDNLLLLKRLMAPTGLKNG